MEQLLITVAVEHKNTDLALYNAKLETFATESRGRLFPGENPLDLPIAECMAKRILTSLLEEKTDPTIQCL